MANWTPAGFIGQLFKTLGGYVTPPPGVKSPALWGTDEFIQENFGSPATSIVNTPKMFNFRYLSVDHWLHTFGNYYGPLLKAIESLEESKAGELRADVASLLNSMNVATDGTVVVPSKYYETIVTL